MPDKSKKELKLGRQTRAATIENFDEENRTLELSFSSDTPIRMYYGWEILDHAPESVRLERFNTNSAPFLVNHDRNKLIGIVESGIIDETQKKGRAVVRFGNSDFANDMMRDVKDKIRQTVSFTYNVYRAVLEEENEDGMDTYRAILWEPLEISLEAIAADISVGVGRSEEDKIIDVEIITGKRSIEMPPENNQQQTPPTQPPTQPVDVEQERQAARVDERKRMREIEKLGESFNMKEAARTAINDGWPVTQFRDHVMNELEQKKVIDTQQGNLDLPQNDIKNYSLMRALNAQASGDFREAGLELEISQEIEKQRGKRPKGMYIPHEVLVNSANAQRVIAAQQQRDVTNTAGSGAALIGTDHMPQSFIALLRARAVMARLGALMLTGLKGNLSIPKQTGAATVAWTADGAAPAESQPTFGNVPLSPKFIKGFVDYTLGMMQQSDPSIEALVIADLLAQITLGIDDKAISGDGTGDTPTGIINTSGVGSVTGTGFDWAAAVELETDVSESNADEFSLATLTRPTVRGGLKTTEKAAGTAKYLMEGGEMNGYPVLTSTLVPAGNLIFGAFNQVIMAFWGALDVRVNPYSQADSGNVRVHVYQSADVAVRNPGAFSVATGITFS